MTVVKDNGVTDLWKHHFHLIDEALESKVAVLIQRKELNSVKHRHYIH